MTKSMMTPKKKSAEQVARENSKGKLVTDGASINTGYKGKGKPSKIGPTGRVHKGAK